MTTRIPRIGLGYGLLALLATGVALYAAHYFVTGASTAPPGIDDSFRARPMAFYAHIGGGALALAIGVWQFLPRTRRSRWHRYAGRAYATGCLVGGIGGLAIAPYAQGGPVAQTGFFLLGALWIGTTLRAWQLVRAGRIAQHRVWIYRSFGLTCAAIALRLILPAGMVLGVPFDPLYAFTAWACWLSSLVIAEAMRRLIDARKAAPGGIASA